MNHQKPCMIPLHDILDFVNDHRSEIELGMCDRNAYRFYQKFRDNDVFIHYGYADVYEDGVYKKEVQHFWNVVGVTDAFIVDVYSMKTGCKCEYRNHRTQWQVTPDEMYRLIKPTHQKNNHVGG